MRTSRAAVTGAVLLVTAAGGLGALPAGPMGADPLAASVVAAREGGSLATQSARRRTGRGRLVVNITGATSGLPPHVVVDGPGALRFYLDDDAVLRRLPRGRYEIDAKTVVGDDGKAVGTVSDDVVRVRPKQTTRVKVTYRWVPEADTDGGRPPKITPSAWEAEVVRLTNRARGQRQNCGVEGMMPAVAPLAVNAKLTLAARRHAVDMAVNGYFSHDSRNGRDPGDRISATGYQWSWWGENIAAGQRSPQEVVQAWLDSDGHCANLMERHFTQIGVGFAQRAGTTYGKYWVQDFARPR